MHMHSYIVSNRGLNLIVECQEIILTLKFKLLNEILRYNIYYSLINFSSESFVDLKLVSSSYYFEC